MADDTTSEEELEVEARPKGGLSGKKLVLFVALPILILAAAAAGAYFTGMFAPKEAVEEEIVEEVVPVIGPAVFYEIPGFLINLIPSGNRDHFLKITISLELEQQTDIPLVEVVMPRIVDNFQVYLRELRIDDLSGTAGIQRLREELLIRANSATTPIKIKDVLFKEMLVH
ncbi:flagellar basal body-associated FliL family protein [Kiloniella antarctica]|uniref:Flagellar protein FliL n=1 Tax=Kiloniella antarctica TaxID=1550907 RepID=A0ABW5BSA6_9PROT